MKKITRNLQNPLGSLFMQSFNGPNGYISSFCRWDYDQSQKIINSWYCGSNTEKVAFNNQMNNSGFHHYLNLNQYVLHNSLKN